jgi:hypothetical protein
LDRLNDAEFSDSETLFRFVHSGKAAWGAFTIEGMHECLYGGAPGPADNEPASSKQLLQIAHANV